MNEINIKICQLIKDKLGKEGEMIKDDASFRDDLDVDSLDYIELIYTVEKEFKITISEDAYDKLKTVGSLVNYVAKNANPDTVHHLELSTVED
jgi:acyl carrier protein